MTHRVRSLYFSIFFHLVHSSGLTAFCGPLQRWHTALDSLSPYLCLSACHVYSARRQEKRIYLAEMQGCFCSHYFVWCLPRLIWTWKRVKCELEPCCSPPYAPEWHLFRERLYWLSRLWLLRETEKGKREREKSAACVQKVFLDLSGWLYFWSHLWKCKYDSSSSSWIIAKSLAQLKIQITFPPSDLKKERETAQHIQYSSLEMFQYPLSLPDSDWLCDVAGYWPELEHTAIYANLVHSKHAQWVAYLVNMLAMQELGCF